MSDDIDIPKLTEEMILSRKGTLYCSFCGKSQYEVLQLIAGPVVFICDECVDMAADIVKEFRAKQAEPALSSNQGETTT